MQYKQLIRKPVEDSIKNYQTALLKQINILERDLKTLKRNFELYQEATDTTLADHEARITTLESYH